MTGPEEDRDATPVLDRLAAEGQVRAAAHPGHRPRMRVGDGSDRLGDALTALRAEEPW
ncbi:hypothetical protein ACFVT5_09985 [Streptomyces sp. NPDC058001]|uniref:hypothetical protein n=1 Tax=Streptomyces sp. NPDC058001 TaxID=3346300 RepID=UPI0036E0BE4A